jgi:hypothetical protein
MSRLKLKIVNGEWDESFGAWTKEIEAYDSRGHYKTSREAGVHYGSIRDKGGNRDSIVVVVRQGSIQRTGRLLVHELAHAMIWILRLPKGWNGWVEAKLRMR